MDLTPALTHLRNGDPRAAHAVLSALLAGGADGAPLRGLLARACIALGDRDGARAALDAGLQLDRAFPPLWLERAMLERVEGRVDEAIAALREAARLMPQQPAIALDLAGLLAQHGHVAEVDAILADVCTRHAGFAPAWIARGRFALQLGNAPAAEAAFVNAQRLAPNDVAALDGIALAAEQLGRTDGEIWARERLANLRPEDAGPAIALADALRRDERNEPAASAFGRAIALGARDPLVRWLQWQTMPLVHLDEAHARAAAQAWDEGLAEFECLLANEPPSPERALALLSGATNFYRHYLDEDLPPVQRRYGALLRALARIALPGGDEAPRAHGGAKLRVGFVSSHFHEHTVLRYFESWVTGLDRARFEVHAFHLDERSDAATARVRARVDAFVDGERDVMQWVEAIRSAQLDVLVHLDIGMHPVSQALSALRLARVQATAWGHPVTTGLDTIDAFLSSEWMEPADGDTHYSERLVRLPGLGVTYAAPTTAPDASAVPALAPGLSGYFLCAQSAPKLLPMHDALFADVLRAAPDHALVLMPHAKAHVRDALRQRIARMLDEAGLDPARRLIVLPHQPHAAFLGIAARASALLDTLGFSGGNTSLEVLSLATPAITLPGRTMRGRQTAAMLAAIGAEQGIATDRTHYAALAARMAEPLERQAASADIARSSGALYGQAEPLAALASWLLQSRDAEPT